MRRNRKHFSCVILLVAMLAVLNGCSVRELSQGLGQLKHLFPMESGGEKSTQELVLEADGLPDDAGQNSVGISEGISQQEAAKINFKAGDYAYGHLTEPEQLWYRDVEAALLGMETEKELSAEGLRHGLGEAALDKIFRCVMADHPEIFYVTGYNYTKYSREETVESILFSGTYTMDRDQAKERLREVEQATGDWLGGLDPWASDYEKVKYVYETVIRNTDYNRNAPENQNLYSVLVGRSSVCQGYAKAVQYLLNCLDVDCTLVEGYVDGGQGHAWNLVKVDGCWYYVDATWGDASYQGELPEGTKLPEVTYDFLCMTSEQLLRTHIPEETVPLPMCTDLSANYYVREGTWFTSCDREQLQLVFGKADPEGNDVITLKCADSSCFQEIHDLLIRDGKLFDYLPSETENVSYTVNETQLSLSFWMTNP